MRIAPAEAMAARAEIDRDPSDDARRKVEAARPEIKPQTGSGKSLALWILLILAFFAAWSSGISWLTPTLVLLFIAGVVGWAVTSVRRQGAEARRVGVGIRAFGLGELERAAKALAFEPKSAWNRVQAAHFRAEIAIAVGDMKGGLAETDRALAALAEAQGGKVIPPAKPAEGSAIGWDFPRVLASQRATALAALGRADEARAEIRWANGFPNALTELRVALIERLAVHDFQGAARLVEGREPDLALAAREEVLADLVRFVARPAARGEGAAARLRADLQRTPRLAAWIDAVAPGLAAAFEAAAAEGESGGRIAT